MIPVGDGGELGALDDPGSPGRPVPVWLDPGRRPPAALTLHTAAGAERELGIPAGTVYSWASRGRIEVYGLDERGRPMYREDALILLHDTPERGTRGRLTRR